MVESQLLLCAMEHLNAEIVQLTVSDISLAIEWLKCSYLYVRIKKNPENYGIKRGIPCEFLEQHMREICVKKINELSEYGMIWTDEDGFILKPLEPGRLMTKFYMKFGTMKDIVKAPEGCSLEDALRIVCHSEEIAWIQLRRNEKKLLNDINLDKEGRLRFHVLDLKGKKKKRIQTREEKIFVLVNDCLTGDPSVHDLSLNQDVSSICVNGCRISKCMKECFIYRKSYKGALNSTLLAKSLHQRLWDDSPYLLKQLPGIGMVTAKALHSAGINSFKAMEEADPRKIEIITGRKYPFGNHIKESLQSLPPKLTVKIEEAECKKRGKSKLGITVTRLSQSSLSSKQHYADILVGSEEDNMILFHEKLRAGEFSSPYSVTVLVSCPQYGKVTVKADLIFEEYIGVDIHEKHVIIWEDNFIKTRAQQSKVVASDYSIPKGIFAIEDNHNANSSATSAKSPNLGSSDMAIESMPSFDLLDGDPGEDLFPSERVDVDSISTSEPGDSKIKAETTAKTIFDHIRKKSKNFPTVVTSRGMDPLILTRDSTPSNQFTADEGEVFQAGPVILIDSEPTEASSPMSIDVRRIPTVGTVKQNDNALSRSSRSVVSSEHEAPEPSLARSSLSSPDDNTRMGDAEAVGRKRAAYPSEPSAEACDRRQGETPECGSEIPRSNHLDVSYLGFRSVFSFL